MCYQLISVHFGENCVILPQTVGKWLCIKLSAFFGATLYSVWPNNNPTTRTEISQKPLNIFLKCVGILLVTYCSLLFINSDTESLYLCVQHQAKMYFSSYWKPHIRNRKSQLWCDLLSRYFAICYLSSYIWMKMTSRSRHFLSAESVFVLISGKSAIAN